MAIESPPKPMQFAANREFVYYGTQAIARAISKTLAKRIANALNRYKPNREGV